MQTLTHEIADGIYRFSTCVPEAAPGGFTFNQFLIKADEPLLEGRGCARRRRLHGLARRPLRSADGPALVTSELVGPALAAEELFHATSVGVATAPTIRRLATLEPRTLAVMHGSSTQTRCRESLLALADGYEAMLGR